MKISSSFKYGSEIVKKFLPEVGNSPGVYFMYDKNKTVLYIGKAKNLYKRISSYTKQVNMSVRIQRMVSHIDSIDYLTTDHEASALILEANMIKKHKPKYNILLRDDKSYPYILLRQDHAWQQIIKARGNKLPKKGDYFGPFASVDAVHKTLNAMQRAFPLRTCSDFEINNRKRPCIQYQIKRCSGPCAKLINEHDYLEIVNDAKLFLLGKNNNLQPKLEKEMELASSNMNYEEAAMLRDRIRALNFIQKAEGADFRNIKDADIFSITSIDKNEFNTDFIKKSDIYYAIQVFFFRSGKNFGNRTHFIKFMDKTSINSILSSFIPQFYVNQTPPSMILVSHLPNDYKLIEKAFFLEHKNKIKIICPQKGENKKAINMGIDNAKRALAKRMSEFTTHSNLLKSLSREIKMQSIPNRIEIYDNSHLNGSNMLGVMVVSSNLGFEKNQYRKFNLKNNIRLFKSNDDYGMIEEVFYRRFKENASIKNKYLSFPDLIIIDGGKGQVNVACNVLKKLNINNIIVIGVSKGKERNAGREKIYFSNIETYRPKNIENMPNFNPLILDKNNPVLYFIQRLRDEAHRFAITSQRKKHLSNVKKSILSEIPGIGPRKRKALMMQFGSVKSISEAPLIELQRVRGISSNLSKEIFNYLKSIK
ncbi:MAG: UvrABC system protein C [Alphaproteobacteria bacterium MarineAlpha9_Bin3]|nr:MAG: UvrABC system protein C [Alphaproteobacteria bacterium MarineAlpha9_Bin3]|tara:strand:+ start:5617 stop:7563 length:1947 start_codon:yes stop_codon:yes gene_type:complete